MPGPAVLDAAARREICRGVKSARPTRIAVVVERPLQEGVGETCVRDLVVGEQREEVLFAFDGANGVRVLGPVDGALMVRRRRRAAEVSGAIRREVGR